MTNTKKVVHVAAAVIEQDNKILIAKRPEHVHQGGLWEFPGGKVEENESVVDALQRELQEEIGITPLSQKPLIQIRHDYPDKSVLLDVWKVTEFDGNARGMEGQVIKWVTKNELSDYHFPEANLPIINATCLPPYYLITPEPDSSNLNAFLQHFENSLTANIKLAQLRAKSLSKENFQWLVPRAIAVAKKKNAVLYINCDLETAQQYGIRNIHLSSKALNNVSSIPPNYNIAASCHNLVELKKAHQIDANFVVLSCIKATKSHPNAIPLGWETFKSLTYESKVPVYALGGMQKQDIELSQSNGGQGIAGISTLWKT